MDELDKLGALDDPLQDTPQAYDDSKHTGTSVTVHAGFPNPAAERTGAPLKLDKLLVKHPSSTYFFRIRGHSWQKYGVFDGDIAILDRAITPNTGDLVVWWEPSGEFVMSRFRRTAILNIWGVATAIIHPLRDKSDNSAGEDSTNPEGR